MTTRSLKTEQDRELAMALLKGFKLPATFKLTHGVNRSNEQNNLQWKWMQEASDQRSDMRADEYQAYCKLHFGIPILRAEDEDFKAQYDRLIRPMSYEEKLDIMGGVIDFPVTRLMNTEQTTRYLDAVYEHFTGLGVVLTNPDGDSW